MFSSSLSSIDQNLGTIVDIEKYPIHDASASAYERLVLQCRQDLAECGSMSLPGFIRTDVIEQMAHEVSDLPTHNRLEVVNLYGVNAASYIKRDFPPDTQLDQTHPLVREFAQDVHAVANDCIPPNALIQQVYASSLLAQFLAAVLEVDKLHQFEDEFQKLNIMYMHDSGNRCWHFDGSDFVVTLMLQAALEGGEFEFSPFLRGPQVFTETSTTTCGGQEISTRKENYEGVRRVPDGSGASSDSNTTPTELRRPKAGTLNLFFGMRSLHRVRTVYGPRKRIMSVLSYHREPNQFCSEAMNISLYGDRVRDIYTQRASEKREKIEEGREGEESCLTVTL